GLLLVQHRLHVQRRNHDFRRSAIQGRASAQIFGILGALVYYGSRGGSSYVGSQAKTNAMILFFFGFIMPNIDNYAHLGGFLGGYAMGKGLDPLEPERIDHVVAALSMLLLSALSVLASLLHGLTIK